jgi:hypothetical protein
MYLMIIVNVFLGLKEKGQSVVLTVDGRIKLTRILEIVLGTLFGFKWQTMETVGGLLLINLRFPYKAGNFLTS